jgi:FkbM family methyltransferase
MAYLQSKDTEGRRHIHAAIRSFCKRTGLLALLRLIGHMHFLRFGIRFRLADFFCSAEYTESMPFEVDFYGLRYPGDLNCYLDWLVYFFGAYETETLSLLKSLVERRNHAVYVDIGANVGHHTLFMSKYATVHAFEPWSEVRSRIIQKVERNGLKNVTVHPCGLSDERASLPFYAPLGANMGTASFDQTHATDRNRLLTTLEVHNGDEYFDSHGIGRVDLIKIDVEGWEKHVLLGLRRTLERERPIVYFEVSGVTLKSFGSLQGFRECVPGFYKAQLFEVKSGKARFSEFDATREGDVLLLPEAY